MFTPLGADPCPRPGVSSDKLLEIRRDGVRAIPYTAGGGTYGQCCPHRHRLSSPGDGEREHRAQDDVVKCRGGSE